MAGHVKRRPPVQGASSEGQVHLQSDESSFTYQVLVATGHGNRDADVNEAVWAEEVPQIAIFFEVDCRGLPGGSEPEL